MNIEKRENQIISDNQISPVQRIEKILRGSESYEIEFKTLLTSSFEKEAWLNAFINDSHHGFIHGNQVRQASLKLMENLSPAEREELTREGNDISNTDSEKCAKLATEIAAIFHDSGRFNKQGEVIAEEQYAHHILSAERAELFCEKLELTALIPYVKEAILCHDFQSEESTPELKSPKSIIGKLVQSSDQLGWFHPDSINRTLNYNNAVGIPFYKESLTTKERMDWQPGTISKDALTVMLRQLFGPTGPERFGINFAQEKVEKYKQELEEKILEIAKQYNLADEVKEAIRETRTLYEK